MMYAYVFLIIISNKLVEHEIIYILNLFFDSENELKSDEIK